ncbi:MAG: TlpA disulfide reductase family protein [Candidatus Acidiferrales bacterium]
MPAPIPGAIAPPIALKDTDAKPATLADALKGGPALVAFFKIGCPTCQFTFPFLQRLFEMYGGSCLTFLGISQDGASDTRVFLEEFGIKFRVLVDERPYPASKAYGLTNVPSLFWINPDGKIHVSSVGFAKDDLDKIAAEAALVAGKDAIPLFQPGERVPNFRPG